MATVIGIALLVIAAIGVAFVIRGGHQ